MMAEPIDVFNNGECICNCAALYSETPRYVEDNTGMEMMYISSISTCESVGVLGVGDDLEITAHYDTREYMPMVNADGTLALVMGISIIFVMTG
jgi:hypothetical protein